MKPTPGQTVGPFFGMALPYPADAELVPPAHPGAIRLFGCVLDGAGEPVPDALVEIWQPAPDGSVPQVAGSLNRDGWTFTGWGRAAVDRTGTYSFTTLRPARPDGAAFFAVTVFARGLLDRLHTRAYLPDDPAALAADPVLAGLDPGRRRTLVARAVDQGYRFDIRLQGSSEQGGSEPGSAEQGTGETVFLAHREAPESAAAR